MRVTGFHGTPLMTFDLRKVELTPLEQRKLTFDSHVMVTELQSSGEKKVNNNSQFRFPWKHVKKTTWLWRFWKASGGAGRLCSRYLDNGQHGRRLQGHGDQSPSGRSTTTSTLEVTSRSTSTKHSPVGPVEVLMVHTVICGWRRSQCSRLWLIWTPSGRTWWSWRRATSPTCDPRTRYANTHTNVYLCLLQIKYVIKVNPKNVINHS